MISNRARARALMTIAATFLAADRLDAQRVEERRSSDGTVVAREEAHPMTDASQPSAKWMLCGAGKFDLAAGGQSVGSETFEVTCKPDGRYSATGRTHLSAGATALELTTTLELGADMLPLSASAKGTVQGQPFDQSGTFANGTAVLVTNGKSQSVPYAPGASWLGGNIFYANMFLAARYDEAKGGVQQFSIFPQTSVSLERKSNDGAKLTNGDGAEFMRYVLRVAGQEIVLWRDEAGRLAVLAVPAQRFTASRPESTKWVERLLGLVVPGPGRAGTAAGASTPAVDYSAPVGAAFTAEEVTIPVSSYSLAGTLLVPRTGKRPYPAVVMITGSGLQTRDSRLPLPGLEQYAPFRQIAEQLASNGIAVLRVDDRGVGGSTGRETLENATTTSLAEDTRAQVVWLRGRGEIDAQRIMVLGHSEGATIAAMVGASDPKIAAVVMMAGVAKRGADVSFEQQEDMLRSDATLTEATRASLREQQTEAVKTILAGGDVPGQKVNAWTREYFSYDPLPTIRKVKQPILILQGERDRQVDQSHAVLLADAARGAGNRSVTVKVLPTLNHLFLPAKTGSFSEYSHLETNVVPDSVLAAITEWIKARDR